MKGRVWWLVLPIEGRIQSAPFGTRPFARRRAAEDHLALRAGDPSKYRIARVVEEPEPRKRGEHAKGER